MKIRHCTLSGHSESFRYSRSDSLRFILAVSVLSQHAYGFHVYLIFPATGFLYMSTIQPISFMCVTIGNSSEYMKLIGGQKGREHLLCVFQLCFLSECVTNPMFLLDVVDSGTIQTCINYNSWCFSWPWAGWFEICSGRGGIGTRVFRVNVLSLWVPTAHSLFCFIHPSPTLRNLGNWQRRGQTTLKRA